MKILSRLLIGIILTTPAFAEMDLNNPKCLSDKKCIEKCVQNKSCVKKISIGVHETANEMLLDFALDEYQKGNVNEAKATLQKITQDEVVKHPVDAFLFLSALFVQEKDYSSAIQTLLKVKDSNNGDVDINLGSIYMHENNYKDAQRLFITGLNKPHSDEAGQRANENFDLVTRYLAYVKGDPESKWMIEVANKQAK